MNIVQNKRNLKRRVEGFFALDRHQVQAPGQLIGELSRHAHIYIFGGMIRDIGLFGKKGFSSDIDLVFAGSRSDLVQTLALIGITGFTENKFGGYRLTHGNVEYDIWSLRDTWAFREEIVYLQDISSLLQTTLMTWDAVIYDIKEKKLITPPNYLQDLINRRLDLVLDINPNEVGSLVRIVRTIYGKDVVSFGTKLCLFLKNSLNRYLGEDLIHYERAHYNNYLITSPRIDRLITLLNQWDGHTDIMFTSQPKPRNQFIAKI